MSPKQKPWRSSAFLVALTLICAGQVQAQRPTTTQGGRTQGGVNRGTAGGARSLGGTSSGTTRQYYPSGTVGEATVTSDPETRRLIVITDEETSEYISQVITNLDRPKPQVLIKVVFLEVTYRNTLDFGVEGAFRHNADGNTGIGGTAFGLSQLGNSATGQVLNALGLPVQNLAPNPPGAGIYQILGSDFQATLRAIAQAGKTEILSRPSILTRNNQQATISLGQEVPLVTNTRFDTLGNQINTVTYQSVGIILRVTPFITQNQMVEMIVSPESSGLADRSQWVPVSNGALAPVINSRVADTVVVIPDGQTVVIGGLMQNNKLSNESKVPILGDIPLLGNLFKRQTKDNAKTELIIFLTPHIVRDPTQLAAATSDEQGRLQLAPKAFTEQDLEQFLDGLPKDHWRSKTKDKKSGPGAPRNQR
jgi:general secretion pathway protein D